MVPKPFSDNIIFFDTEFTDLNAETGQLLSVGLVKPTGEELYLELEYDGPVHSWVESNVLPYLKGPKVSRADAQHHIRQFIGGGEPFLVAYVNQFDAIFWYKLFGSPNDHPAFWIPIDFASILFAYGYPPNSMGNDTFLTDLGLKRSDYNEHVAIDDARLLAEAYKRFYERVGG